MESIRTVIAFAGTVATLERCLSAAGALTTHIVTQRLVSPQPRDQAPLWLWQLCAASGRCADAAASALRALRGAAVRPDAHAAVLALQSRCQRGASELRELLEAA